MTGYAWVFLAAFIAALVLLVIALAVLDEQSSDLRRLRRQAFLRIRQLEQEKTR